MAQTGLNYNDAVRTLTGSEMKEWRYSIEGYVNKIERLSKYNPEKAKQLQLELDTLAMRSRISRLDTLKASINAEVGIKTLKDEGAINKGFTEVFNKSYSSIQSDFKTKGAQVETKVDKKFVEDTAKHPWSGSNFSDNIWGTKKDKLCELLNKHITIGSIQGLDVNQITENMRKELNSDFRSTQRIVRTELNYALGQANLKAYGDDGIKQYEMLACGDNRMCEDCEGVDGQKFNIEDATPGVNYHPMHANCRCTSVPVVDRSWMDDITPADDPPVEEMTADEKAVEEKAVEKTVEKAVEKIEKDGIIKEKEKSNYDLKSITDANMDFYNSKDFENVAKEALEPITDNPKVVESFINASREILEAKGKTALEAGIFIDLDTAEIISKSFNSKEPLAVNVEPEELKRIFLNDKYKRFVAVHNHPNSTFPSYGDLKTAFNRGEKQKYSVIICHDGTVYAYDTPNSYIKDRFGESDFLTIQDEHYNDFNKFAAEMHEAFAITIRRYNNGKK